MDLMCRYVNTVDDNAWTPRDASSSRMQRQTVLIVDDNEINVKVLFETLKNEYEILTATSGKMALDLIGSGDLPDLILLDIEMPELDGYTVCQMLNLDQRTRDIPVIFISARDQQIDEVQGLEMGAVDYITKPFSLPSVRARVRAHLKLKRRRDFLESVASRDGLTGIANRRCLENVLMSEWRRAQREARPLSVIMADIDLFKHYNDTYGHGAGDFCLRRVAQALQDAVGRPGDMVARYGGEEFVAVLPCTGLADAQLVAERMRRRVASLSIPCPGSVTGEVTISLGVAAAIPTPESSPQDLVNAADAMLYVAKSRGRNRVAPEAASENDGREAPAGYGLDGKTEPTAAGLCG